ncbi:hypothetical protein C1645_740464 [Glomus cerebriforme]|uniref:TLDc domain-containing protein n=1 Tax=Glomus cerebriforme TaxID=658196 RepID=A0A397SMR9_9GLOM|nr:hypothetical protein C1645_740464 [Glomus cerebriforme]
MKPKTNLAPSRRPKIDSTLVESDYISLFASWIDKKDSLYYNKKHIPYEFKLLYRSNRDDFDASSFHSDCDNKGATIWIAKIQDSTQLIGGYNPLDWNGNGVKRTADSFLFNFTDGTNISTAKLGYVIDTNKAIFCYNNQGPSMGGLFCGSTIGYNAWTYGNNQTTSNSYPDINIPRYFNVENYEVFQIIKR